MDLDEFGAYLVTTEVARLVTDHLGEEFVSHLVTALTTFVVNIILQASLDPLPHLVLLVRLLITFPPAEIQDFLCVNWLEVLQLLVG